MYLFKALSISQERKLAAKNFLCKIFNKTVESAVSVYKVFQKFIEVILRKLTERHVIKLWVLFRIIRWVMFVSQEWPKRADKASLLTASGMLLHAFPSIFVRSLQWISGKLCIQKRRIQLFYWIFCTENF
jgi:hypothetical protein